MMEQAKNKDASWEFLKWWTSKDVQVRFGREMEGLMGAAARYPTANIEALKELPWPVKDYNSWKSNGIGFKVCLKFREDTLPVGIWITHSGK